MRAIFALVVLVGCSYAMPQELGASPAPVIVVDPAAADTPAAATNVEPAPAEASASQQDVNRQGIAAGIAAAPAGGAGGAGGAGAVRNPNPYGAAFYGPGLNNPMAIAPLMAHIKTAQQVAASNPNIRVRVLTDGTIFFTDQYGQEVEVVDQFGLEPFEPIDPAEAMEFALVQRQMEAQQRILQLTQTVYRDLGLTIDGATFQPGFAAAATVGRAGAAGAAGAAGGAGGAGAAGGVGAAGLLKRNFSVLVA